CTLYWRQPSYSTSVTTAPSCAAARPASEPTRAEVTKARRAATIIGSSLPSGRAARADLPVAAALHVRVDLVDGRGVHTEGAPGGHAFLGPTGADHLHERLLGRNRAVGLERHHQMRRDGGAEHVLAVTAG